MMHDRPSVAVITRTKNRPLLLRRAIESVLGQVSKDWHHIIVNDGGHANEVDALLSVYTDSYAGRLKVIHNEQSKGMEAASNIGIQSSDSKYVVIHDDDDSWEANFIGHCLVELEGCPFPSVKGVVTHITQIFEKIEGNTITEVRRQKFDPNLTAISIPQITEINKFLPIAFMFEREVFDEIGYFDESLPVIGDWEFNIRYFMKYDAIIIKEDLANYYVRTESASNYYNTVSAGKNEHLFHRALIVNKHIRKDLENGNLTKGLLFAYGDYFHRIGGNLSRIGIILDRIRSLPPIVFIRRLFNH